MIDNPRPETIAAGHQIGSEAEGCRIAGIGHNRLGLSVGLEDEHDFSADLDRALAGSTSEPASLCRYEEMAKRENRLRALRARSIEPPK